MANETFTIKSIAGREIWKGEAPTMAAAVRTANLSGADLSRADLSRAYLSRAYLSGADLSGADLSGAYLSRAYLSRANLSRANLSAIRDDFRAILDVAPKEVLALRRALLLGNIDGSAYRGECACLVGTIANVRRCNLDDLVGLKPDADRAAERWFLAIKPGDDRRNNQVVSITLGWIDEWLKEHGVAVPRRPKLIRVVGDLMRGMTRQQRAEVTIFARKVGAT